MEISKEQNEVLKDAIATFGQNDQLDMVKEECAELIVEVCKFKRRRTSNLTEEVADVFIMIKQLELMVDNPEEIQEVINRKIARLNCRIADHKKKNNAQRI